MHANGPVTQSIWRTFLSGLATILPIAITLYIIVWLARAAESLFGGIVQFVLPAGLYVPGMGIVVAILVVLMVGAFLKAWIFSYIVERSEQALENIPVIKTVYTGLRDLLDFISRAGERGDLKRVVSVELQPNVRVIGFVTDDQAAETFPELALDGNGDGEPGGDRLVSVYLPMGYQIGGYTLYLPASRLRTLDLTVEEAMRVVLTAGINRPHRTGDTRREANRARRTG